MENDNIKTKRGAEMHQQPFDPNTGKFIEDGKPNKYYENSQEQSKIDKGTPKIKIQQDSANSQENPIGNLGEYGTNGGPGRGNSERIETLKNEYGIDSPSVSKDVWNGLEDNEDLGMLSVSDLNVNFGSGDDPDYVAEDNIKQFGEEIVKDTLKEIFGKENPTVKDMKDKGYDSIDEVYEELRKSLEDAYEYYADKFDFSTEKDYDNEYDYTRY